MLRGIAAAVYITFLLSPVGAVAFADGNYQRTKDGKTMVWNDRPKPGDIATWSGDRDRDGYAAGFGTLTWYATQEAKQTLYAYYFGNMVRGKFHGPVNGHSKGVTGHAMFIDGKRTGQWAAGPAPSWRTPAAPSSEAVEPPEESRKAPDEIKPVEFNPPPPSYAVASAGRRPVPNYEALHEQSRSEASATDIPAEEPSSPNTQSNLTAKPANGPQLDIDESLRTLTGPPAGLRPLSEPPSGERNQSDLGSTNQHLGKAEVIGLADGEAQKRGYDLSRYARTEAQFDAIDNTWSLVYEAKGGDGGAKHPKRFTVAVDDKTKRIALVEAR